MQALHLVLADICWSTLVVLAMLSCGQGIEPVEFRAAPEEVAASDIPTLRDKVKAYIAMTKPRVISLLLFTTMTALIAAEGTWPGIVKFLAVLVGGYASAGSANTINMVIDRDIDFRMKRTAARPTVTQLIPSTHALAYAAILAIGSFVLLWGFANLLSAVMALSGLVFYVVIYTMLLKRRTTQNIVIGGAAGAFPPLVGWAAATNELPPLALYLFAIIFVWTPVHFWALALLLKEDYTEAGVPMLPVVKGDRITVIQIGVYAVATVIITTIPFMLPQVGYIYGISAVALNALLVRSFLKLRQEVNRPNASGLFHFSMAYLAALFLMFMIDRVVVL
jgi:protoheme IX farnesyltransferase